MKLLKKLKIIVKTEIPNEQILSEAGNYYG